MSLREGGNTAVIVRGDGSRQVYHFLKDEDRPFDVMTFDEDEAQQLANLMGQPLVAAPSLEKLDLALGALEIEWIKLRADSPLVGKTLKDVRLRTRTGASLIAIMRGSQAIPNPDIDLPFQRDDTLVIIGSPEQCEAAQAMMAQK